MVFAANLLLAAGCFSVAFYCIVLSRRLKRLTSLDKGLGGAIAVMSAQVDDMTQVLKVAQASAQGSEASLRALTGQAEDVAGRLELMLAALHDVPPLSEESPPRSSVGHRIKMPAECAGAKRSRLVRRDRKSTSELGMAP